MDNKTFIDELSSRCELDRETVVSLTELLCDALVETIVENDSVTIASFGSFDPRLKAERVVVHPSTGRKMLVPPKLTITFKPSALLKQKVK